jgi:hypothetical protein
MSSDGYEEKAINETRTDNPYSGQDNGKEYTDRIKQFEEQGYIPAMLGFHGYVNHKTHFLAGEDGSERVSIRSSKTKKHNNKNIYSVDNLSYSPSIFRRVFMLTPIYIMEYI